MEVIIANLTIRLELHTMLRQVRNARSGDRGRRSAASSS
jgi:hypothetical protein